VVSDVAALVEHLGCRPVRLLGWSQEAAIAQEVASARPDLVAAAPLIATYGRQNSFDRLVQQASGPLSTGGETLDPRTHRCGREAGVGSNWDQSTP